MARVFILVPTGHEVGLTTATLGFMRALHKQDYNVGFVKPISQMYGRDPSIEGTIPVMRQVLHLNVPDAIPLHRAERMLSSGKSQELMEEVVDLFQEVADDCDVVVVEGMVPSSRMFYTKRLNALMIRALDADVILVSSPNGKNPEELAKAIEIETREYQESLQSEIRGCIINKIGRDPEEDALALKHTRVRHFASHIDSDMVRETAIQFQQGVEQSSVKVCGAIPWLQNMIAPTVKNLTDHLNGHALRRGEWTSRRVESLAICSMGLAQSYYYFQDGALIVTTGDRSDIILGAAMATLNGVKLAGLLLCGRFEPDPNTLILCERAFAAGLPLISTSADLFYVSSKLTRYTKEISLEESDQAGNVMDQLASYINPSWIKEEFKHSREHRISPPEFRNLLIKLARRNTMRIVLPEGEEPRTIRAAITSFQRKIAIPVLLGNRDRVKAVAEEQGLTLPDNIEVIEPASIAGNYVDSLMELRKKKGLTREQAEELLKDEVYVGTMMLKHGDVDGLVSGAVHSTAATVRPAMQIIKTAPGSSLVSSIFFMCLPHQVLVYGDCAINQDPTAEELSQIALQSAESAKVFKIPQRVAMISYSTGASGFGADVDKVRQATEIVKTEHPEMIVDGPLQYDAATTPSVARTKAPDSKVAGQATVLVFPDLNTGNTTYKAVQRSANLVSIGPMLQGLAKPVNDLSRGALVDDIIYTIALTAIQAQQMAERDAEK
jgi:phosphate acetyltransferase